MGHIIKDCPLKSSTKTATETARSSPIKDAKRTSSEHIGKNTSTVHPPPKHNAVENKMGKESTSTSKMKIFQAKKSEGKMLNANFYSLLDKTDLSKEDEDRLDYIPATQLDGKRLEREVIAMDATYKESKIVHEADDVPPNAVQEHLEEEELLASKYDIEMEYLKDLQRDHALVGSPIKGK